MSNYSESYFSETQANTSWYKASHLIPEKSQVLDIGCSSGHFGQVLIEHRGCTVDGIEVDRGDAKAARQHLGQVYELNIETDDLSVMKSRYDIIYLGDVIEHLVTPVSTLERV